MQFENGLAHLILNWFGPRATLGSVPGQDEVRVPCDHRCCLSTGKGTFLAEEGWRRREGADWGSEECSPWPAVLGPQLWPLLATLGSPQGRGWPCWAWLARVGDAPRRGALS